jgi:hypothetical protein
MQVHVHPPAAADVVHLSEGSLSPLWNRLPLAAGSVAAGAARRCVGGSGGWGMATTDKVLVVAALVLGLLEAVGAKGPLTRLSPAGIAIVLLAVVMLHRGGVLTY